MKVFVLIFVKTDRSINVETVDSYDYIDMFVQCSYSGFAY